MNKKKIMDAWRKLDYLEHEGAGPSSDAASRERAFGDIVDAILLEASVEYTPCHTGECFVSRPGNVCSAVGCGDRRLGPPARSDARTGFNFHLGSALLEAGVEDTPCYTKTCFMRRPGDTCSAIGCGSRRLGASTQPEYKAYSAFKEYLVSSIRPPARSDSPAYLGVFDVVDRNRRKFVTPSSPIDLSPFTFAEAVDLFGAGSAISRHLNCILQGAAQEFVECQTEACRHYEDGDLCNIRLQDCSDRTTTESACKTPCAAMGCKSILEGALCGQEIACHAHVKPSTIRDACLEPCHNTKCEFREETDNTCLELEPCGDHILQHGDDELMVCGSCMAVSARRASDALTECFNTSCPKQATEDNVCLLLTTCKDLAVAPLKKTGHWDTVIDDKIVCRFSNKGVCLGYAGTLDRFDSDAIHPFTSDNGGVWTFCKILDEPETVDEVISCLRYCSNNSCLEHRDDNTCMAVEVCEDRIMEDVIDESEPDLLQGYTLEQWDEIIKGGYLCEFTSHPEGKFCMAQYSPLYRIEEGTFNSKYFVDGDLSKWSHCRPAQIPGVMRPWFGGECPVDPEAQVFFKVKSGLFNCAKAKSFRWSHTGMPGDIVAYMEV